jgi:hypothetical protein
MSREAEALGTEQLRKTGQVWCKKSAAMSGEKEEEEAAEWGWTSSFIGFRLAMAPL